MNNVAPRPPAAAGFTLIELLIVVAIISILAAIAVPNFLEAQTRSKVSRTKADARTLMFAVQAYQVDNNVYPVRRNTQATSTVQPEIPEIDKRRQQMSALTTPLAYIGSLPADVFESRIAPPNNVLDYYDPTQVMWLINSRKLVGFARMVNLNEVSWLVLSVGPDGFLGSFYDTYSGVETPFELRGSIFLPYDPTNGTISTGNIYANNDWGMDYAGARLTELAVRR
jgi:type II secretion system protein G